MGEGAKPRIPAVKTRKNNSAYGVHGAGSLRQQLKLHRQHDARYTRTACGAMPDAPWERLGWPDRNTPFVFRVPACAERIW